MTGIELSAVGGSNQGAGREALADTRGAASSCRAQQRLPARTARQRAELSLQRLYICGVHSLCTFCNMSARRYATFRCPGGALPP